MSFLNDLAAVTHLEEAVKALPGKLIFATEAAAAEALKAGKEFTSGDKKGYAVQLGNAIFEQLVSHLGVAATPAIRDWAESELDKGIEFGLHKLETMGGWPAVVAGFLE